MAYFYRMEHNNLYITLQEWLDENEKLDFSQEESIKSYTKWIIDSLDEDGIVDVMSSMLQSMLSIKKDVIQISTSYDKLYESHRKMAEEMYLLLSIIKNSSPK